MNSSIRPKDGCLSAFEIAELAEDLLPVKEAQAHLAHVAQCDECAALLRHASRNLHRDLSPAEQILLDQCLENPPARPPVPSRARHLPLWAVAAGIAVFAAGGAWFFARQSADVPRLLAEASMGARPFEWRLPHTGYSPLRLQRGGGQSVPAALLEAQAALADQAESGMRSEEWFRLRGWSELLEQQVNQAVETLGEARRLAPDDLEIAGLLGVAHAARGDYDLALLELSRVLERHPKDPVALYNRGMVYATLGRMPQAHADWQALGMAETDRRWATELRQRFPSIAVK